MTVSTSNVEGISLKIANLEKRFGNHAVLRNLNLSINAGEFVTIVGRSGCGKTTLLRLIAGLEKISSGQIFLDDQITTSLHPEIKIMFQDSRLLPWQKVLDNVRLGLAKDSRSKAMEVLHHVGLAAKAKEYPSTLSGGQKQRVALARALVSNPRLLLLDEPLGALDALTRIEMQRLLENLWQEQKFTAFLITHDVEEAVALGNRVILLEEGSIVLDVKIDLLRPRARGNAEFASLVDQIRNRVMGNTIGNNVVNHGFEMRLSVA
ncbi:MAG: ATP-binding cassette domain-containing protein [Pseudanabaena sp. ELA607]